MASAGGHVECVKLLLDMGAEARQNNKVSRGGVYEAQKRQSKVRDACTLIRCSHFWKVGFLACGISFFHIIIRTWRYSAMCDKKKFEIFL